MHTCVHPCTHRENSGWSWWEGGRASAVQRAVHFRDETKNWKKRLHCWDRVILEGRKAGRKEEKGEDSWRVEEDGRLTHCCVEQESSLYIWKTPGWAWKWDQTCIEIEKGRKREAETGAFILPLSLSLSLLKDEIEVYASPCCWICIAAGQKMKRKLKWKAKGAYEIYSWEDKSHLPGLPLCPIGRVLTSEGFWEGGGANGRVGVQNTCPKCLKNNKVMDLFLTAGGNLEFFSTPSILSSIKCEIMKMQRSWREGERI